ncbi:hypothetical protein TNCV_1106401 [Trichonephila clavipes]|nr:hypothetical protein TNCV_1106401 [Trichonephila clavipes]
MIAGAYSQKEGRKRGGSAGRKAGRPKAENQIGDSSPQEPKRKRYCAMKLLCVVHSPVFMFLDFAPDLPNESINFAFVWRVSGVIPNFSKSIFSSDKLSDVYRKAEVWSVDYSNGSGSRNSIRYIAGKILNG